MNKIKKSDAIHHLNTCMYAVQKLRSMSKERGEPEWVMANGWKWIFGEKSIITALSKMLDNEESITPHSFYNIMYIAFELEPLIGATAGICDHTFPMKLEMDWLRGWEEENV